MKFSNAIIAIAATDDRIDLATDGGRLRIYLMDDDVIRFRCTFDDEFAPDHSYALVKTAWPDELDGLLAAERTRVAPITPKLEDRGDHWRTGTAKLTVILYKEPFGVEIRDAATGAVLHRDLRERSFMEDSNGRRMHYSVIGEHDHCYGFGEKTGPLNKLHRRMRMHNVDACGYDAELSDPLYKHIPFYIRFNDETRRACGMFYDNPHDATFDMGRERSGYWERYCLYEVDGGDVDWFFINGPTIPDVVRRYTDLTGKSALPPIGDTGYGHTTMYYTELERDADDAIVAFAERCRREGIPLDAFALASGYTCMPNGKRYQFHWNEAKFKDPAGFVARMKELGVAVTPNVKPGILTTHPDYDEYDRSGAFVRAADGERTQRQRYWGGFAGFPDFTSAAAREIWERHMTEALLDNGIDGIWDDNCEFEIDDADARVDADGSPRAVGGMRPALTNMMAFTSTEALLRHNPDRRPYVISRAGYAGIQRYAQTWAGDNATSWKTLRWNIATILGMGLSGAANHGADIGGWFGPRPEPELLVRWFQEGAFMPRFMTNSSNTDNTVTEPFMYPSYTPYIADAVRLRYRLAAAMYSLLRLASVEGDPVMRPLVYEFPDDPRCWDEGCEFMFGADLLVANVLEPGATEWPVYLPAGCDWYEWGTRRRHAGGQTVTVPVDLGTIPMFLRAGAVLPLSPDVTNLHTQPIERLEVLVEPSRANAFALYEDDGASNAYRHGNYLLTTLAVTPAGGSGSADGGVAVIEARREGRYASKVRSVTLDVFADAVKPFAFDLETGADGAGDANGRRRLAEFVDPEAWAAAGEGWIYDAETTTARVKFANPAGDWRVLADYGVNDLVKM
ncbi:TIM-barrel domain-containing protein [Bifidobacterium avesanii]|uniref:DUF4968 domain-containing protein n=1 Tax=Bifidobacterium avesanii TaxID=1798157 RepID=A0A7K3TGP3_9BIFI|nr:TIM-barrel domain-containing protein [Bifidobacterium avesanii]KAB8293602.1 alpha-glucosidase [Bifidobacterium avesanii]NEG78261.1 DUF4968 domain-containing protein [Bifidobacterium avesanii]